LLKDRLLGLQIFLGVTGISSLVLAAVLAERTRADAKLRESEELYRSLFNNMLNGFAYCKMIPIRDARTTLSTLRSTSPLKH